MKQFWDEFSKESLRRGLALTAVTLLLILGIVIAGQHDYRPFESNPAETAPAMTSETVTPTKGATVTADDPVSDPVSSSSGESSYYDAGNYSSTSYYDDYEPTYDYGYDDYGYGYDGYTNVDGNYIPSPSYSGNTIGGYSPRYTCSGGSYSYAQHRQGACSYHGGVAY